MSPTASAPTIPPPEADALTPRITALRVAPPFVLVATFADGAVRRLDLTKGVGTGPIAPPDDPAAFAQAAIEPGGFGVTWPTGSDLHRDSLYLTGQPVEP